MKKFLSVVLVLVIGTALTFGMAYAIDRERMDSGKPVVFSTWGKDYTAKSEVKAQETKNEVTQEPQTQSNQQVPANNQPATPQNSTTTVPSASQKVDLYYIDSSLMNLGVEKRTVDTKNGLEKAVVEAVIAGPQTKDYSATISSDVKVLSASVVSGTKTCAVDLSKEFLTNSTGGDMETFTLYSIVNSLCSLSHIDEVKITVEGEQTELFGYYDISKPIKADMTLVAK